MRKFLIPLLNLQCSTPTWRIKFFRDVTHLYILFYSKNYYKQISSHEIPFWHIGYYEFYLLIWRQSLYGCSSLQVLKIKRVMDPDLLRWGGETRSPTRLVLHRLGRHPPRVLKSSQSVWTPAVFHWGHNVSCWKLSANWKTFTASKKIEGGRNPAWTRDF